MIRIGNVEIPSMLELCELITGNKRLCEILAGVEHKKFVDALIADIVDFIPVIGDITNVSRVAEAKQKRYRLLEAIDLLLGSTQLPDILPANLIRWYETHIDEIRSKIEERLREIAEKSDRY